MSNSVTLLSTHPLTREELFEIMEEMRQKGADIDPEEVFDARISRDEKYIWVFLYNAGVEELSEEDRPHIDEVLGGSPQSSVEIEISRQPGSEELAVEFSYLLARRWPCIVSGMSGKLFSRQELFVLHKAGKGFLP